jgi:hypothetical protein
MKPIWYFVGLLLIILGTIVLAAGIYTLVYPPPEHKVLAQIHPNLWWGTIMMVSGLIFLLSNRKKTVG